MTVQTNEPVIPRARGADEARNVCRVSNNDRNVNI